ncbi:siderophore-interacting protein [Corynebacterium belfantii]|uniref:siderophore-interacting protein n=1 Tax=Corynebacterium belfantii TaxID=2014537 RepID=UPI0035A9579F
MAVPCSPAQVERVTRLTPHMIRISFRTIGAWRWNTDGSGDEHIDIALPHPGETEADLTVFNLPEYGPSWKGEEPPWRHYTVRAVYDHGRVFDIDFAIHGDGIASTWAERAEPGHVIGAFHGGGSYYRPPADATFHLLVADATGLPGLGRIIEEMPAATRALAIIEVPERADIQAIKSAASVEYRWLTGTGNGRGPSALPAAVAEFTPPDEPWYAWAACEAASSRSIRSDLRKRLSSPRNRHHVIGYWTESKTGNRPAEMER